MARRLKSFNLNSNLNEAVRYLAYIGGRSESVIIQAAIYDFLKKQRPDLVHLQAFEDSTDRLRDTIIEVAGGGIVRDASA